MLKFWWLAGLAFGLKCGDLETEKDVDIQIGIVQDLSTGYGRAEGAIKQVLPNVLRDLEKQFYSGYFGLSVTSDKGWSFEQFDFGDTNDTCYQQKQQLDKSTIQEIEDMYDKDLNQLNGGDPPGSQFDASIMAAYGMGFSTKMDLMVYRVVLLLAHSEFHIREDSGTGGIVKDGTTLQEQSCCNPPATEEICVERQFLGIASLTKVLEELPYIHFILAVPDSLVHHYHSRWAMHAPNNVVVVGTGENHSNLDRIGDGIMELYCPMATTTSTHAPKGEAFAPWWMFPGSIMLSVVFSIAVAVFILSAYCPKFMR